MLGRSTHCMSARRTSCTLIALTVLLFTTPDQVSAQPPVPGTDRDCPGLGCPPEFSVHPSYAASEVKAFFGDALHCPEGEECIPKTRTGAICVGSACATAAPHPSSFDLEVTFELGSDRLNPQAKANLGEFAAAMKSEKLASVTFNIDGHTDASGTEAYNLELSIRRAKAVVSYLESLGIAPERLQARGFGESEPRTEDPFAAVNRRVEATLQLP
jgi:OmpA-OmpF porin, OOP family